MIGNNFIAALFNHTIAPLYDLPEFHKEILSRFATKHNCTLQDAEFIFQAGHYSRPADATEIDQYFLNEFDRQLNELAQTEQQDKNIIWELVRDKAKHTLTVVWGNRGLEGAFISSQRRSDNIKDSNKLSEYYCYLLNQYEKLFLKKEHKATQANAQLELDNNLFNHLVLKPKDTRGHENRLRGIYNAIVHQIYDQNILRSVGRGKSHEQFEKLLNDYLHDKLSEIPHADFLAISLKQPFFSSKQIIDNHLLMTQELIIKFIQRNQVKLHLQNYQLHLGPDDDSDNTSYAKKGKMKNEATQELIDCLANKTKTFSQQIDDFVPVYQNLKAKLNERRYNWDDKFIALLKVIGTILVIPWGLHRLITGKSFWQVEGRATTDKVDNVLEGGKVRAQCSL